nr:MAG TPA: hypothetical protein [Caudoviricetes sp.]DAN32487.1 MAG TPA: hypothetical protein [Caudoviricetes sp.]DAT10676.1 MAG TPA: hypothetical protein [Bacteriophage sp.]
MRKPFFFRLFVACFKMKIPIAITIKYKSANLFTGIWV